MPSKKGQAKKIREGGELYGDFVIDGVPKLTHHARSRMQRRNVTYTDILRNKKSAGIIMNEATGFVITVIPDNFVRQQNQRRLQRKLQQTQQPHVLPQPVAGCVTKKKCVPSASAARSTPGTPVADRITTTNNTAATKIVTSATKMKGVSSTPATASTPVTDRTTTTTNKTITATIVTKSYSFSAPVVAKVHNWNEILKKLEQQHNVKIVEEKGLSGAKPSTSKKKNMALLVTGEKKATKATFHFLRSLLKSSREAATTETRSIAAENGTAKSFPGPFLPRNEAVAASDKTNPSVANNNSAKSNPSPDVTRNVTEAATLETLKIAKSTAPIMPLFSDWVDKSARDTPDYHDVKIDLLLPSNLLPAPLKWNGGCKVLQPIKDAMEEQGVVVNHIRMQTNNSSKPGALFQLWCPAQSCADHIQQAFDVSIQRVAMTDLFHGGRMGGSRNNSKKKFVVSSVVKQMKTVLCNTKSPCAPLT